MGQVPLVTLWALVSPQENGADGCVRSDGKWQQAPGSSSWWDEKSKCEAGLLV